MKYKYKLKKPFKVIQIAMLIVCVLLTIGRWYSVVDADFVLFNAEIHAHISNLTLSMALYLAVGCSWLMSGVRFRFIIILGVFLIAANFVCETLMGFMNTTDIMDAIYGTIGTVTIFTFLLITSKYGLSGGE